MPTYDEIQAEIAILEQAKRLLDVLRTIFYRSRVARRGLELYQAETNEAFNAAIDSIFSEDERTELGQMLVPLAALVSNWEANHLEFLFPPEEEE